MTIQANLADGRVLEFPDGTDPQVIQATVKRIIGGDAAPIVEQAAPQDVVPQQAVEAVQPNDEQIKGLVRELQIAQSMGDMQKVNQLLPILQPVFDAQRKAAGEFISGIPAALPTIVSGAVAQPIAGLGGLGEELLNPVRRAFGADEVSGAETVKRLQDKLTIDPLSDNAKGTLSTLGEVLEPIGSLPAKAGQATFEATGSPIAATAVESGLTILPELVGLKGFKSFKSATEAKRLSSSAKDFIQDSSVIKTLDDMSGVVIKETPTKDFINAAIKQGDADVAFLGKTVKSGRIAKNPFIKEAVNQGLDEKVLRSVETANPKTKSAYRKAFEIFKERRGNADFAATNRSSDVMGNAVYERYRQLDVKRKQIGKRLGDLVKNDLAQKPVNITSEVGSFFDDMQELGLQLVPDERTGRLSPDVSQLDALSTAGTQAITKKILDRVGAGEMTVKKAHSIKKLIDDAVDFGKPPTAETTLPRSVDNALKKLRSTVNKKIADGYPRYGELNKRFGEIQDPLSEMDRVFKSMLNIDDAQAVSSGIGTKAARTLMSNNVGRATMLNLLKNTDEVLAKNGVKFQDDLIKQAVFIDELERVFGSEATTSLGGSTTRAIEDAAINSAFGDASTAARGLLKTGYEKLKGINEENAVKAFEAMLK